jgi:hypothetical protein
MGVAFCPFWEDRLRVKPAPDRTYLQPAKDHMSVLSFGVEPEKVGVLLQTAKPAEKQKNVSFSDTVVEKVGTCRIRLPEHGQPAGLPSKIIVDKVRVQMAKIGPSYPGFSLPAVETQLLHH